jgi:hypothetical protein
MSFDLLKGQDTILESCLSTHAKILLIAIIRKWSRKNPTPFLSRDDAARLTSMSGRTLDRAVREIKDAGIPVQARYKEPNVYEIERVLDLPRSPLGRHSGEADGFSLAKTGGSGSPNMGVLGRHSGEQIKPLEIKHINKAAEGAAAAFGFEQEQEQEQEQDQALDQVEPTQPRTHHPADPSSPTASEELPNPPAPLGSGTPETLDEALDDLDRRIQQRRAGDPSWSAALSPAFAVALYIRGMENNFGDAADSKIAEVDRHWTTVVARAEDCLGDLATDGAQLVKYAFWFFKKMKGRSELPGWRLMLGFPGMVSDFLNRPNQAPAQGPVYYPPSPPARGRRPKDEPSIRAPRAVVKASRRPAFETRKAA